MDVLTAAVPAERCLATAKGTGERCRKYAIRGAKVCVTHGAGASQVRAKAAERVELAVALASEPRRHPAEVLLDTLHAADVMMRRQIAVGDPVDAEGLAVLLGSLERAQRFARSVLDLDAASRMEQMHEKAAARFVVLFDEAMSAAGLSDEQHARALAALREGLERLVRDGETT